MSQAALTCILCPMSCTLDLTVEGGKVTNVSGNSCKQGPPYAEKEYTLPTRSLTSTVGIQNSVIDRLPVKTNGEIARTEIHRVMAAVSRVTVAAPIQRGQVILTDAAGTGIDIIATRSLPSIVQ
ncbi:MAG: DUF1667 domain-containing protein [Solirubrobacterales bacterium]